MTEAVALSEVRDELHRDLLRFVRGGVGVFEALALRVIAYQRAALPAFSRLCGDKAIGHWSEAPLVPTELFRELDLCSAPEVSGQVVFRTSGTTHGKRGYRRVPDLTLYDAAMAEPFIANVLGGDRTRRRWVSLIPRSDVMKDSSLSHMVSALAEPLSSESYWAMDRHGLDVEVALRGLNEGFGAGDEPVVLLTTAFALVELIEQAKYLVRLAPGSRVMVTGGFKGKKEPIAERELFAMIKKKLGVPPERVVSEYGMTELSSQAYGVGLGPAQKAELRPMSTLRFAIVDPSSGTLMSEGQSGLVACFDLLNLDNVSFILTSDVGRLDGGALTLEGRLPGAVARGCGLTAEELIAKVG
ncbi:MAG TPA: hypothetical protein PK095_10970 [Myxococcota bacterium]|nr:hypothetical protein [Myxococcota bacterium]